MVWMFEFAPVRYWTIGWKDLLKISSKIFHFFLRYLPFFHNFLTGKVFSLYVGAMPWVKGITKSKSMLSYCLMQPLLLVMPLTSGPYPTRKDLLVYLLLVFNQLASSYTSLAPHDVCSLGALLLIWFLVICYWNRWSSTPNHGYPKKRLIPSSLHTQDQHVKTCGVEP